MEFLYERNITKARKKEKKRKKKEVLNQCIGEIESFQADDDSENHIFPSTLTPFEKKTLHNKALELDLRPIYIKEGIYSIWIL